jgi:large subunit ribosomal protein L21
MKYAIVVSGGKQFKAIEGSTIEVDLLPAEVGQAIQLDSVLLLVDGEQIAVGTPNVSGAKVSTTVVSHIQGPKIYVFHYGQKKKIRSRVGHRQQYTRLLVNTIETE